MAVLYPLFPAAQVTQETECRDAPERLLLPLSGYSHRGDKVMADNRDIMADVMQYNGTQMSNTDSPPWNQEMGPDF